MGSLIIALGAITIAIVLIFSVRNLLHKVAKTAPGPSNASIDEEFAGFLRALEQISIVPDPYPSRVYKAADVWAKRDLLEFYRQIIKQSGNTHSPFVRGVGFYSVPKSRSDESAVAVAFSWEVRPHPDSRGENMKFRILKRDQDSYIVVNEDMPSFPFSKRQDYSR